MGGSREKPERPGGPLRQLLVLAFLAGLVGLGLRSLLLHDARFGWGMFTHEVDYSIQYHSIGADGLREPYSARKPYERSLRLRDRARLVSDQHPRTTRQGIGALRSWVRAYLRATYAARPTPGTVAIEATIDYSINRSERTVETLVFPAPPDHADVAP